MGLAGSRLQMWIIQRSLVFREEVQLRKQHVPSVWIAPLRMKGWEHSGLCHGWERPLTTAFFFPGVKSPKGKL